MSYKAERVEDARSLQRFDASLGVFACESEFVQVRHERIPRGVDLAFLAVG